MAFKTIKLTDDIDTSGFASYNGHPNTCMCVPCLSADIDAAAGHLNVPLSRINDGDNGQDIEPTRTRYAAPGTKCGNGVVRTVSPAQVRYMKNLLAERDTSGLTRLPGSEDIENMSLRGARDLIDRLLACPMKPAAQRPTNAGPKASEKQVAFAKSLAERKAFPLDSLELVGGIENISSADMRKLIDNLLKLTDAPKKATEATEGMYLKDGVVYKVQRAVHGSGNLYAKKFDAESKKFEYVGVAPLRMLSSADRMTLEQAKNYSALYGVCIRCATKLTLEESIERAMGRTCAGKF